MPVLHLLAGPNGAGKTTFFRRVLGPATHLEFINADELARQRWPGDEERHGHEASELAAAARAEALDARRSFCAETVFSHPSKLALIDDARGRGYLVTLHVVLVPVELTVVRVGLRVRHGGHSVPERKVRERFERLWKLVAAALARADLTVVYDNTSARRPFREVARFESGCPLYRPDWPDWSPLRV